jgi:hypothetical protein
MVPLPVDIIIDMYSHILKLLIFKGYLQENGYLMIDSEGSQIQHIQNTNAP